MTTCRCCGQPVNVQAANSIKPVGPAERGGGSDARGAGDAAGALDAIWVDEALMACCNAAYEAAAARGAGQVEIAHFLFVATRMDAARDWFASAGISTERFASLLVGEMRGRHAGALPSRGRGIETSSQLQALIYRAREDGLRRGLSSISVADVLGVLVAQADVLGMREKLSTWLGASAIVRSADGGAGGARERETFAQFARGTPPMREAEAGPAVVRQREQGRNAGRELGRTDQSADDWTGNGGAGHGARNVARDLAGDVASEAAGGGYAARGHELPVPRAKAQVQRGDDQMLVRMEERLAEQDRALRAMSEQLARVEAAARAGAGSVAAASGRAVGPTRRGYRASASRWRQRKRGGFIGAGRGSGIASRSGRSAVAGSPDGSRDGSADRSRRGDGDGSGGGSGRGNGFGHVSAGGGGGLGSGAGRGHASESADGSGSGYGTGNPSPGNGAKGTAGPATSGLSNGAGASGPSGSPGTGRAKSGGSGSGSGSASGYGTGKPSGSRKSRGRRASGHAPRDRYGRMRLLRQRLSSRRRLRNSREDESERDDYRAARLPRERDASVSRTSVPRSSVSRTSVPRSSVSRTWEPPAEHGSVDAREERDTSALTHDGSHGTSWARAPWSERTPHPHSARAATAHDEADEETVDHDDGETREKRFYLALDDDVVAAPSIGPRTAGRLIPNGIITVRDLLACDAEDLAAQVTARHITADRIRAWQAQARLVCTIPWLRGTHAQMLVGAGYLSADEIVADTPDGVCAAILAFAATREGQSVLRSGEPPQMERLLKWVEHAGMAEPERAELAA